jgi:methyltransferase (TIGR00027 family)
MPPKFKFTKEEILESAFNIVRRSGWKGLSARSLANELGSSSRPMYSFFGSITELKEEIVKKAVDLLYKYMTRKKTGDPWYDHGIGYVMFALKEKHLFRSVNDEDHIAYFKKYGDMIWHTLTTSLTNYPPFQRLSQEQIYKIQVTRWLFAHGLAFQANNPPPETWNEENIVTMMKEGSQAIYDGLVKKFNPVGKGGEMGEKNPTKMALQIAGLRANETHLPENERVFEDPYAEYFFDDETRKLFKDTALVKSELAKYEQMMPGVNGAIVARIKFIDEYLIDCVKKDFKQLVIIGAGYDTRAYRFDTVKENVKVFEVDHPVTQEIKVSKINKIFGSIPDYVVYVPIVFGADRLDQKLFENGYRPELKTLFIVEGLLMYIPPVAVDGLLSFITNASGPGSAIVADYFSTAVVEGTSPLKEAQVLRQFVESEGSSLQFGIDEGKAEEFFIQRGFHQVTNVTTDECKQKYFMGNSQNRSVSPMFNFVKAVI